MGSIGDGMDLEYAFNLPDPLVLCPRVEGRPEATRNRP